MKLRHSILLYARVPDPNMLDQGFYADELAGLSNSPDVDEVRGTYEFRDVLFAKYDGLVGYFFSYASLAAIVARARGKTVVLTGGAEQLRREYAPSSLSYVGRIILFYTGMIFATSILAVSSEDLGRMRTLAFFFKKKLRYCPHGIPGIDELRPEVSHDLRDPWSFVTICGLDSPNNIYRKGLPEALRLIAEVAIEYPAAALTIVGRDTRRDIVESLVSGLGIEDRVSMTGYVTPERKADILKNSRFYLQLSHYEGFGIGALEALSAGCIVVHSGAGGLRDTVGDFGIQVNGEHTKEALDALPNAMAPAAGSIAGHLAKFSLRLRAAAIIDALFGNDRNAA